MLFILNFIHLSDRCMTDKILFPSEDSAKVNYAILVKKMDEFYLFQEMREDETEEEDARRLSLTNLQQQFDTQQLEELYKQYENKINHGYYSMYLIKEFCICLTHFLVVLFSVYDDKDNIIKDLPDLILYITSSLLALIGIFVIDWIVAKTDKWKRFHLVSFALVALVNWFVPVYHFYRYNIRLRPTYSSLLVISCYVFFDIFNIWWAIASGFSVSLGHILLMYFLTYVDNTKKWQRIASDLLFQLCINGMGVYFRLISEVVKRRSFLDRRQCVNSTVDLSRESEQQDRLMSSIIPSNILKEVKKDYANQLKKVSTNDSSAKSISSEPKFSLTEMYENVSILFADIVHYTEMTKKLDIQELVTTLNDLFCSFDTASDKLKVTRIKFLGDCYYCVAGMNPGLSRNHAEDCVDLGLEMIDLIADVRRKRDLNINMRIGVHSGKFIGGIIGKVKIQFDIFSKDVNLANLMESEGQPGKVHITQQTMDLINAKKYTIEKTDKRETVQFFMEENLDTFLVTPKTDLNEPETSNTNSLRRFTKLGKKTFIEENNVNRNSEDPLVSTQTEPRRQSMYQKKNNTNNNNNNTNNNSNNTSNNTNESIFLHQMVRLETIDDNEAEEDVQSQRSYSGGAARRATISKKSGIPAKISWRKTEERRTAFMKTYKKRFDESQRMVNDTMVEEIKKMSFSKYEQFVRNQNINFLMCFRTCKNEKDFHKIPDPLFMYYVGSELLALVAVFIIQNLTLSRWDFTGWPFYVGIGYLTLLIPLTATQHLWERRNGKKGPSKSANIFLKFFYDCSSYIINSSILRHFIYVTACFIFGYSVLSEVIECYDGSEEPVVSTKMELLRAVFHKYTQPDMKCVIPWHMTETCILAILMTFLFLRMNIWMKFSLAILITAIYGFCVFRFNDSFYEDSETFNQYLKPQIAHILGLVFLTFTLQLIDRQNDYMYRQDFLWNKKLRSQKNEVNQLRDVNKHILKNILPDHVAKKYLTVEDNNNRDDLYSEEHSNVAIMFATILYDYDMQIETSEETFLEVMNFYICEFDKLTRSPEFNNKIEKIKIAKWTYMVACGLTSDENNEGVDDLECIEVMTKFAAKMLEKLKFCNNQHHLDFKLRIGISHGPIVAGVVGSKKPLYDIWGDAVNMASRMDTTGEPNKIQVLASTKEAIELVGFKCIKRGKTKVKGFDGDSMVDTYFVALDHNHKLIHI